MAQIRLLSKTGCTPCRARRKKCPEDRPFCKTCRRLGLRCAYRDTAPGVLYKKNQTKVIGVFRLGSPAYQTQNLVTANLRTAQASFAILNVTKLFEPQFLPTFTRAHAFDQELKQIALSSDHVSECITACCEALISPRGKATEFSAQQAWNQASKSLRTALQNTERDETLIFTLPVAVGFLALIEFVGPGVIRNCSVHLEAGVALVGMFQQDPRCHWLRMPRNVAIGMLETILAQVAVTIYMAHRENLTAMWKRADIVQTLNKLTSPGEDRVCQSPGMAGQYEIFDVLFDVMMLHRRRTPSDIPLAKLDLLERKIQQTKSNVEPSILLGQDKTTTKCTLLVKTFELLCLCLLICTNALKAPSTARDLHISEAIREGLDTFVEVVGNNSHLLVWPAHILACAVTTPADKLKIRDIFRDDSILFLGAALDRFRRLLHRLDQIYDRPASNAERELRLYHEDVELPRGLLLLRQKGGVLANEF